MDAVLSFPVLVGLIVVALAFDFLNGLHDAANSIATIVSTRVLRPQYAVAWAAFFNFIAFLFFGLHVANTLGTGIIAATVVDPHVVFGALMGAIIWQISSLGAWEFRQAARTRSLAGWSAPVSQRLALAPLCGMGCCRQLSQFSRARR